MFDEGVKDSLYRNKDSLYRNKDMIMKVTPAFINSNLMKKDYHQYFSEVGHASQQGFTVYRK